MILYMNRIDPTTLFLGIDAGGSTCRARLRKLSGEVIGEAKSGPANLRLGASVAIEQILACTEGALKEADLENYPLKQIHAGLGLAGAVLSEELESASHFQTLFATCEINNDAYIACVGAHLGHSGAVVIVGTGSCAQVVSPEASRTYGGWGFDISDQASGAWIGQQALQIAVLAMDGLCPSSAISSAIGDQFSHRPADVLRWSQSARPNDYAKFAPLVFSAAEHGDTQAMALVQCGCEQLEQLIRAVERHGTGRIALLGGLAPVYLRHLPKHIISLLCTARGDALDGALLTAGLPLTSLELA